MGRKLALRVPSFQKIFSPRKSLISLTYPLIFTALPTNNIKKYVPPTLYLKIHLS